MPPCAQIFSDRRTYLRYAEHFEDYRQAYFENRLKQEQKNKIARREINTPEPNPKHKGCNVCGVNYADGGYKLHIRGERHANAVKAENNLYS